MMVPKFVLGLVFFSALLFGFTERSVPDEINSSYGLNVVFKDISTGDYQSVDLSGQVEFGDFLAGFTIEPIHLERPTEFGITEHVTVEGSGFIGDQKSGFAMNVETRSGGMGRTTVKFVWRTDDFWVALPRTESAIWPLLGLSTYGYANLNFYADSDPSRPNSISYGDAFSYEFSTGVGLTNFTAPEDSWLWGGFQNVAVQFGVQATDPGQRSGTTSLTLGFDVTVGASRDLFWDFTDTFAITAMKFSDGTTPEDHGFDIVFGSGRSSPNAVVPSPSALAAVLGMGAVGLVGMARRRWKKA